MIKKIWRIERRWGKNHARNMILAIRTMKLTLSSGKISSILCRWSQSPARIKIGEGKDAKIQPLKNQRQIIIDELYYAYGKNKIDSMIEK